MDALVKTEAGKGLKLMQVPVPEPKMGEVLIKIRKTAICGTDVHIYNWDPWAQQHIHPAMTIGHEYVGEIAQLGEGVKELYVGQRVSGEGHIVCGHCRNQPRNAATAAAATDSGAHTPRVSALIVMVLLQNISAFPQPTLFPWIKTIFPMILSRSLTHTATQRTPH